MDITASHYGKLKRRDIDIGTPDPMVAGIVIDNNLILTLATWNTTGPLKRLALPTGSINSLTVLNCFQVINEYQVKILT